MAGDRCSAGEQLMVIPRRCAVAVALSAVLALPAMALAGAGSSPSPGTAAYAARDARNMTDAFGRQLGSGGQLRSPAYPTALLPDMVGTELDQLAAQAGHPTRPAASGGNLVPGWNDGNPYRVGWSGRRGRAVPVSFTGRDGALLSGTVYAPLPAARDPYTHARLRPPYPGVVVVTGSDQGSAGAYTWVAEDLAERGYAVLTFDVQGQGRSETAPHDGTMHGVPFEDAQNFVDGTQDAVTFFTSTPAHRYRNPHSGSARVDHYNPMWRLFDRSLDPHPATPGRTTRLALIGHSTGAVTASYLQGVDRRIATVVALDKLTATPASERDIGAGVGTLPGPVRPVVPALGMQSEYGFEPQPYWLASCSSFDPCPGSLNAAPDPNREEATGFSVWRRHRVDSMVVVPRASTHLEYSDVPFVLPASQRGQAMASYYVQAWLDKYLKHQPGADARLLSHRIRYIEPVGHHRWTPISFDRNEHLSFYFCSGIDFHRDHGHRAVNLDLINDGC